MQLTAEQEQLSQTLRAFLEEKVTAEYRKSRIANPMRSDDALLKACRSLGIFEGFEGDSPLFSLQDLALVSFECGRVALPEPIVEMILARDVLWSVASPQERDLLKKSSIPRTNAVLAYPPACSIHLVGSIQEGPDPHVTSCTGRVAWVRGECAEAAVLAWCAGPQQGDPKRAVVILGAPVEGVSPLPGSLELTVTLSSLNFADTRCVLLSEGTSRMLEFICEVMQASDAAGVCDKVIGMTKEYACTREQFGVPIGGFQAVQHTLADAYVQASALKSLVNFAAWALSNALDQVPLVARAAGLAAATIAPKVCESAIQLHGGIGFTWEYELHLYLRRARAIGATWGETAERVETLLSAAQG